MTVTAIEAARSYVQSATPCSAACLHQHCERAEDVRLVRDMIKVAEDAQERMSWVAGHDRSGLDHLEEAMEACQERDVAEQVAGTLRHALAQILHVHFGDMDEWETVDRIVEQGVRRFDPLDYQLDGSVLVDMRANLRDLHRPFDRPVFYGSNETVRVCNHCLGPVNWPCPTARYIYAEVEL